MFSAAPQTAYDYGCAQWNLIQGNKLWPGHEFNAMDYGLFRLVSLGFFSTYNNL